MNKPVSPWENLRPSTEPGTSLAVRVDAEHPHDFFWGLSARGHPQLICRLPGNVPFPEAKDVPSLNLINVQFQSLENKSWCIVELCDRAHEDNFRVLAGALVEAARKVIAPEAVLPVFLRHLSRWQKLLGRSRPAGVMSFQEQLGLFGELFFLHTYVLSSFSQEEGIFSWVAPQEHPQDFLLASGTAAEIKCRQATSSEIVHVASQHQLHQPDCPLYLIVFSLGRAERDQASAFSLYNLVQTVRRLLAENEPATEEFELRLLQRGYVDVPDEYDQHWWRVNGTKCFAVSGGFPRLEPAMLPAGIIDINYSISLADCTPWACDIAAAFNLNEAAYE